METHLVAHYVKKDLATYSDSFRVEHITKEIKKFTGNKLLMQILVEYKHVIQQCLRIFVLDLLISC